MSTRENISNPLMMSLADDLGKPLEVIRVEW